MRRSQRLICVLALLALGSIAGCSGSSPTQASPPSTPALSVAGSWRGTATDSSGPGQITMQVTQSGNSLSGTVTMSVTGSPTTGRGTLSGSLSGSVLRLTITIPAGGFDAPYTTCTANVTVDGQASATSMTATYLGTNSCSGPITKGELTVSKG